MNLRNCTQLTYAVVDVSRLRFDDDSDIDVVYGDETITLHYEEDLDDLATVSVDRTGVPEGGQVHVTVSDFRLNLDPTVRRRMGHVCRRQWHPSGEPHTETMARGWH